MKQRRKRARGEDFLELVRTVFGRDFRDNDLQEWVSVDDKEPTYQFLTDKDIIQSVREGPEDPIQEPVEEEDDDVVYDPPTTVTQAAKDLENALRWFESSDSTATAAMTMQLRNLLHYTKKEARQRSVQRKMTDFFTRP